MSIETKIKTNENTVVSMQPPKLWKVVFLNDDKTPMEFVVDVLVKIFKHSEEQATELTLEIHNTGSAVAGIYNYEVAEQKGLETTHSAKANGFPLQITLEEE